MGISSPNVLSKRRFFYLITRPFHTVKHSKHSSLLYAILKKKGLTSFRNITNVYKNNIILPSYAKLQWRKSNIEKLWMYFILFKTSKWTRMITGATRKIVKYASNSANRFVQWFGRVGCQLPNLSYYLCLLWYATP